MAPRKGTTTRKYFSPQLSRSKSASHCLTIRKKERPDVLLIHMDAESHNLAVQKNLCRDTTWYWRLDTIQVKAVTRDSPPQQCIRVTRLLICVHFHHFFRCDIHCSKYRWTQSHFLVNIPTLPVSSATPPHANNWAASVM